MGTLSVDADFGKLLKVSQMQAPGKGHGKFGLVAMRMSVRLARRSRLKMAQFAARSFSVTNR
jgi:hypothetical protein